MFWYFLPQNYWLVAFYLFVCLFRQVVIKMPNSAQVFDDLNNSSVQVKTVSSQYFKPLQMIDLEMKWQPFWEHALHWQISNWCFVCEEQQGTLFIALLIPSLVSFLSLGPHDARVPHSLATLSVVGRMSHLPCCDWPGNQWGSDAGACSAALPVMTTFNLHLVCDLKQFLLLNLQHLHLLSQPPVESSARRRHFSLLSHESGNKGSISVPESRRNLATAHFY